MFEIERKFLIDVSKLPELKDGKEIIQAYLFDDSKGVIRIRKYDDKYILTIKLKHEYLKQIEIEKDLTKEEFDLLLTKCDKRIVKTRYKIGRWEVDFFIEPKGLVLAEYEMSSVDEKIEIPDWCVKEVTGDPQYYNCNLIKL